MCSCTKTGVGMRKSRHAQRPVSDPTVHRSHRKALTYFLMLMCTCQCVLLLEPAGPIVQATSALLVLQLALMGQLLGKKLLSRFCATSREIRDFKSREIRHYFVQLSEKYGTLVERNTAL
eukprot:SAG31_NODE_14572_length_798_cov_2.037196_2_plen_119_part_01